MESQQSSERTICTSRLSAARTVSCRETGLEGVSVDEDTASGVWTRTGAVQAGQGTEYLKALLRD